MKRITISALLFVLCVAVTAAQSRFTPSVEKRVDDIMSKMTLDEKLTLIGGDWMYTKGVPRLGIGQMRMSDGPQGLGTHGRSTAYPSAVLLAATWDKADAYRYGTAIARDCHAKGVNIHLGPAVNIYRAPMCGRNFEYMGEDPFLSSAIAVGYIRGVQDHGVMSVVKHFAFNNSEYDRHHVSDDVDERTMNEIYFPAFRAAVQQAEVGSVMSSYNLWRGIYTSENPYLMTDVLRKQWGFKGMVMSDWEAVHHAIPAARSGLDLEMPSAKHMNVDDMKYYLTTGDVTMSMIDSKVRHILRTQLAFGFDKGHGEIQPERNDAECAKTALDVARDGIVLLKNTGVLPVDTKKIRHIVVTGDNALGYVRGGGSGNVNPISYVPVFDGISKAASEAGVSVEYVDPWELLPSIAYTDNTLKEQGFNATYYNGQKFEGTPIATRRESHVSYQWPGNGDFKGLPANNFSVKWTGVLCSPKTLDYVFTVGGDDGYRLKIDGKTVAEDWKDGAFRKQTVTQRLEAGRKYDVTVELYQAGGGAAISFYWNTPKGAERPAETYKKLAKADLIIASLGFNADTEYEDADRTFALPDKDRAVLDAIAQAKRPTVGLINSGGGVEMQSWEPSMKGLLWLGYSGQEAGTAVADILFGKVCPSGRLPMTWEKRWEDNPVHDSYYYPSKENKHVAYKEGVFVGYRGYDKLKRDVQYPFGFGLSYTNFSLSGMNVSDVKPDGTAEVSFTLKNTGRREGAQVVQCYVGKKTQSIIERPVKELRGFDKISLKPGESKTVKLTLPRESFMYYDENKHDFTTDRGLYDIMLGFSSRDIKMKKSINL